MLIQPSVQSASYGATFASSVSATGVEQTVTRAPFAPIEEAPRSSGAQTQTSTQAPLDSVPPRQAGPSVPSDSAGSGQDASSGDETAPSPQSRPDPAAQQQELADQALLEQLRARDREVRIHEAAHAAVGGRYAGSASFQYQRGPDGRNYAVGGEVGISTSPVSGNPQATIEKARTIRAAALAPAEPSAQDRRVAAEAAQMEVEARTELQAQTRQERAAEEKARAEAAKEKAAKEKVADEQPVEEVATETQSDAATSAETAPVFPPPVAQTAPSDSQSEEGSAKQQEKPRPNARERLEQLLLGTGSILQQANRQGLVDPQNPYGKSGYLDVIA